MSDNLPDRVLGNLDGQAALFEDPLQILGLADAQFIELVAAVRQEGESVLRTLRRIVGLIAWAGWHRYDEKRYREFVADFAERLGVEPRAVLDWRRAVTKRDNLPMPAVAQARSSAAKSAGQTPGATKDVAAIPATSSEAANTSEGARVTPATTGKGASGAPSLAPSDPSGGHGSAEEQAEDHRTGGLRPARPPALDTDTPGLRPPADPFSDADGVRWLRSKTDAQVRALGDPWRQTIQSQVERWALAMGIMRGEPVPQPSFAVPIAPDRYQPAGGRGRSPGRVIKPEDRANDPLNCTHPKANEHNAGYFILCGLCRVKLR